MNEIEMMDKINNLDRPISIRAFSSEEDRKLIQQLIYKDKIGVTSDWKLWPIGKKLP